MDVPSLLLIVYSSWMMSAIYIIITNQVNSPHWNRNVILMKFPSLALPERSRSYTFWHLLEQSMTKNSSECHFRCSAAPKCWRWLNWCDTIFFIENILRLCRLNWLEVIDICRYCILYLSFTLDRPRQSEFLPHGKRWPFYFTWSKSWMVTSMGLDNRSRHSNPQCSSTEFSGFHSKIDGLVQDCSISIAKALEILQSCTKPSI